MSKTTFFTCDGRKSTEDDEGGCNEWLSPRWFKGIKVLKLNIRRLEKVRQRSKVWQGWNTIILKLGTVERKFQIQTALYWCRFHFLVNAHFNLNFPNMHISKLSNGVGKKWNEHILIRISSIAPNWDKRRPQGGQGKVQWSVSVTPFSGKVWTWK